MPKMQRFQLPEMGFEELQSLIMLPTSRKLTKLWRKLRKLEPQFKNLLKMFSGEAIPVTFLTLMDIYGRWLGIRISGRDPKMNKS